jgi:hypothetical protein
VPCVPAFDSRSEAVGEAGVELKLRSVDGRESPFLQLRLLSLKVLKKRVERPG